MAQPYSYIWFINQFKNTKVRAEEFILSVDENLFLQSPAEGKWSIAECYSHLLNYGDLYFDNIKKAIVTNEGNTEQGTKKYPPRWLPEKIISFFEPPYKMKVKTVSPMQPTDVSDYDRMTLLEEYLNLQDQVILQLEKAHDEQVNLGTAKLSHPIFSFLKMTLSECFLLLEAHQRRHQWQAEQTLKTLKEYHDG